jgi:hypothetical protein
MLYRFDWDDEWRQAIIKEVDDATGRAELPIIKDIYERFCAYRQGDKAEPIIWSVGSSVEGDDSASSFVGDWRMAGRLAVSLGWPGTAYLRLVR